MVRGGPIRPTATAKKENYIAVKDYIKIETPGRARTILFHDLFDVKTRSSSLFYAIFYNFVRLTELSRIQRVY